MQKTFLFGNSHSSFNNLSINLRLHYYSPFFHRIDFGQCDGFLFVPFLKAHCALFVLNILCLLMSLRYGVDNFKLMIFYFTAKHMLGRSMNVCLNAMVPYYLYCFEHSFTGNAHVDYRLYLSS